jgi:hypothetical protein
MNIELRTPNIQRRDDGRQAFDVRRSMFNGRKNRTEGLSMNRTTFSFERFSLTRRR